MAFIKIIHQTADQVYDKGFEDGYAAGEREQAAKMIQYRTVLMALLREIENCVEDGTLPREVVERNKAIIEARCLL